MKALSIVSPGKSELIDLPKPSCQSDEVLIEIAYVAFCGSDLSTFQGRNPMVSYPRVPGHEISGKVVGWGKDVTSFQGGEQVTVIPYTACGKCPSCRRGRVNACRDNQTLGVQREGAMTEYISVPENKVIKVDGLALQELAMIEPLTVGFHSVNRAEVNQEDVVLVFGAGMIGLGAIAAASNMKATVIAVDIADEKLVVAKSLGADFVINSSSENLIEKVNEITEGNLCDVVIEAVGHTSTYQQSLEVVAFAGRVSCIGYAKENVPLTTKLIVQKELDVRGSRNATRNDFEDVIQYLKNQKFPLEEVVNQTLNLHDAPLALESWSNAPGDVTKLMIQF